MLPENRISVFKDIFKKLLKNINEKILLKRKPYLKNPRIFHQKVNIDRILDFLFLRLTTESNLEDPIKQAINVFNWVLDYKPFTYYNETTAKYIFIYWIKKICAISIDAEKLLDLLDKYANNPLKLEEKLKEVIK